MAAAALEATANTCAATPTTVVVLAVPAAKSLFRATNSAPVNPNKSPVIRKGTHNGSADVFECATGKGIIKNVKQYDLQQYDGYSQKKTKSN